MEICPFSGQPCPHQKNIHVSEVMDNKTTKETHCCENCGGGLLSPPPPPAPESPKPQLNPQAVSLFEILKALIHNKFKQIPGQVVLTNIAPEAFAHKPPCPVCGASLHDIAVSQQLGCPGCYEHYGKELLPVLIHAHKSCEHVGKVPKYKPAPCEENVQTLTLRLAQAVEQENYERAKEIKAEIDRLRDTDPQP